MQTTLLLVASLAWTVCEAADLSALEIVRRSCERETRNLELRQQYTYRETFDQRRLDGNGKLKDRNRGECLGDRAETKNGGRRDRGPECDIRHAVAPFEYNFSIADDSNGGAGRRDACRLEESVNGLRWQLPKSAKKQQSGKAG